MTDQPGTLENPESVTLEQATTAVIAGSIRMHELGSLFDRAFNETAHVVQSQGVAFQGLPFGYHLSMPTETVELEAGFMTDRPVTPEGDVVASHLPGGRSPTPPTSGLIPTPETDPSSLRTDLYCPLAWTRAAVTTATTVATACSPARAPRSSCQPTSLIDRSVSIPGDVG
ncbi:MAG TPA: hypothetical protein VES01_06355 [Dermatophilaceae bacterium]|nr:hypothetical protein [Dermatophilaceae bacterium]